MAQRNKSSSSAPASSAPRSPGIWPKAGAAVTIVDAGQPGGVATANSFAWINASWGNPEPYFRLRMRAIAEWTRLEDGGRRHPARLVRRAVLGPAAAGPRSLCRRACRLGLRHPPRRSRRGRTHRAQSGRLAGLRPARRRGGCRRAGAAAQALLADAERRGARAHDRHPRRPPWFATNDRVIGVETPTDVIAADEVVLAAGVGCAGHLPRPSASACRSRRRAGLIVHSRPHGEKLLNGLVLAERLHMRQTAEGRIVAGSDFGGADPGMDPPTPPARCLRR